MVSLTQMIISRIFFSCRFVFIHMKRQLELLKEERALILSVIDDLSGGLKEQAMEELRNIDFEISAKSRKQTIYKITENKVAPNASSTNNKMVQNEKEELSLA